jgi:hypothetical protein
MTVGVSFSLLPKSRACRPMTPGWLQAFYVHGVTQLPTVNVRDFQRFKGLRVIHPAEVIR